MMTIGAAAYLRRYLPATTSAVIEERMQQQVERSIFSPAQLLPYVLLAFLLFVLTLNIFATDPMQAAIRPVLLLATLSVVALVVLRQILTLRDNAVLARQQAETLEGLERANKRIAEQSHAIAQHNLELEHGIDHLKDVQANLANGNLRIRARLDSGALLPLAASLNLMAERLTRLWQINAQAQRLSNALRDLSIALDKHWSGEPLAIPEHCTNLVEISALLRSLHIKSNLAPPSRPMPSLAQSGHMQIERNERNAPPTTGPLPPRKTSQGSQSTQATPLPPTRLTTIPRVAPLAPATNEVRTGTRVTKLNGWRDE
jgi:hypothetical protein